LQARSPRLLSAALSGYIQAIGHSSNNNGGSGGGGGGGGGGSGGSSSSGSSGGLVVVGGQGGPGVLRYRGFAFEIQGFKVVGN
jgi:hypothetical protein